MNEWNMFSTDEVPPTHQRIMVSDGETITIAQYTMDNTHITWIFDNPAYKDINVAWWMPLPENPPKIPLNQNT